MIAVIDDEKELPNVSTNFNRSIPYGNGHVQLTGTA
jgi:hypothetical protein